MIDKNGEDITKDISYILQFIDRAKFYEKLILQGITDADYLHRVEI